MSDNNASTHSIGEFVSFELIEDMKTRTFTITLTGPMRFSNLIALKVGDIRFSDEELREWIDNEGTGQAGGQSRSGK